jgi:hypothetical protein
MHNRSMETEHKIPVSLAPSLASIAGSNSAHVCQSGSCRQVKYGKSLAAQREMLRTSNEGCLPTSLVSGKGTRSVPEARKFVSILFAKSLPLPLSTRFICRIFPRSRAVASCRKPLKSASVYRVACRPSDSHTVKSRARSPCTWSVSCN